MRNNQDIKKYGGDYTGKTLTYGPGHNHWHPWNLRS